MLTELLRAQKNWNYSASLRFFFLLNAIHPIELSINTVQLSSDHLRLLAKYNSTVNTITLKGRLEIPLLSDIEDANDIFLNIIHFAAPVVTSRTSPQNQLPQSNLPSTIVTLLILKRRIRRQFCRTRNPIFKRIYRRISKGSQTTDSKQAKLIHY